MALVELAALEDSSEAPKPGSWTLFESIDGLVEVTDLAFMITLKSRGQVHEHFFLKSAIKEGIFDI